jgi:hypothetical protein
VGEGEALEFYERGCQEKILLLTWRTRIFPDSQPRVIGCTLSRGSPTRTCPEAQRNDELLLSLFIAGSCSINGQPWFYL